MTNLIPAGCYGNQYLVKYAQGLCTNSQSESCLYLTHNGENDYDKVKDVPADGEEIAAKGDNLNDALSGEDDNKGQVDIIQDGLHIRGLLICLHHHGQHVQEDKQHDDDVEGLF